VKATAILPVVLITLNLGSAAVYACYADWKRMTYWIAAAVLTACVSF
jgi:hypothetical protein